MPNSTPTELSLENLDLTEFVKPGDTVTWGQACAEPLNLTAKLVSQRKKIGHFTAMVGLMLSDTLLPEYRDDINVISYGAIGTNTRLAAAGALQVLPCNYSAIPQLITSRRLAVDVVLVQLSPIGPDGHYSLGLANDYLIPAMQAARVVIGEVNDLIPCTTLDQPLDHGLIDYVVPCSGEPLYATPNIIGDTENSIARHLLNVIEDGAVIQYGIGSVPSAILAALSGHRRLGIHSGMLTDDIIPLIESGAITNENNRVRPGITVGALAIGSESLNRFLHLNQSVELHPATTTHSAATLAKQDRLVAINSAFEIDIYGQINAEMVGDRYLGAVGGQIDFMHAASTHPEGLSIVAMPSVTNNGKHSRIVARLNSPLVTTSKADVDIVVTEHGVADLRGKTLQQRATAIHAIADPLYQEDIMRAGHIITASPH
jgi:acyl-CoA hydrolase